MSPVVIEVTHLSKEYRLGTIGRKRLSDDLSRWWAKFRGGEDPLSKVGLPSVSRRSNAYKNEAFWALSDVNFQVRKGEVLGIIGRNGAGKSTLLKILSRVTAPSSGAVRVRGRIASLLEVGTGFHPELTGRENIYLNGAILGMTKVEINNKFDEIVAFSETETFLDTPVKRYSSGMYVRLAFAVAAHLEPEILIVDEVLAVGDATFQNKCLGKMGNVAREGRTILFVSHNMVAVQNLCTRGILLADGMVEFDGSAAIATGNYASGSGTLKRGIKLESGQRLGTACVEIAEVCVYPTDGRSADPIKRHSAILVSTKFIVASRSKKHHLTYHLINCYNTVVLTTNSKPAYYEPGEYRAVFELPGNLLNSGNHFLRLLIVEDETNVVCSRENIVSFCVDDLENTGTSYYGREPGAVQPPLQWQVSNCANDI